ncbi:MAG: hypothetical protein AMK71_10005 [Nitrospira bacterium SG8_35_4]|nr:MAG: hypothetical protein AMK71_10005 [Nitrospira bacterium SG8_35_4]
MNKMKQYSLLIISAVASILLICASVAFSGSISEMTGEDYEKVSWGGLLYDNWYSVLGVKTGGSHPSYPKDGQQKGGTTWRCKECHGWDYQGKDGAYAMGSHFTGIKGIRQSAGMDPEVIATVLKADTHTFGPVIPEKAYQALAYFVAYGQIDMDRYIDRSSKKAGGERNNGAKIFLSTCAKCHGMDGKKINFKTPDKPEYLGTVANKNPWETLHKIRYGQPDTEMVNLLFLTIEDQIDMLSYCQSLPVE